MNNSTSKNNFLWGSATASFQVEGGIDTCDWAQAGREGKVPVCGLACDHYNRFKQDFDIAKELGHNAHRFSIEWARIEPQEGVFDESAMAHYRAVLEALRERDLEPIVTLWHWTLPTWLSESGGIERKDFPQIFARYCSYVATGIKGLASHIVTLNEPYTVITHGWLHGDFPPFKRFPPMSYFLRERDHHIKKPSGMTDSWLGIVQYFTLANRLAEAHIQAYNAVKQVNQEYSVGLVFQVHVFRGASPLSRLIARFLQWHLTHRFLRRALKRCDILGINYYHYTTLGENKKYRKTDMGWDIRPEGIYDALMEVKRYKLPIMIDEAGCADAKDAFREEYIAKSVEGVLRARADGVDVRGFIYWSLMDNYEWANGFDMRFGLVEIDFDTQKRTIRPSAFAYRKIIEANSPTIHS